MKNIFKYFLLILSVGLLGSCTDGFEEANTNPEAPTTTVPDYLFTNLIKGIGYNGGQNLYLYNPQTLPITRLGAAIREDLDVLEQESGVNNSWSEYYGKLKDIKRLRLLLETSPSDIERHRNQLAMIDIYEAFHAFRVTDKFGAMPLTEAGQAADNVFRPVYDSQTSIYTALLDKVKAAVASLTTAANTSAGDSYFDFDANAKLFDGGDAASHVISWKKFGNSLILKHALRMSKLNAGAAQTYIASALAGPLMTSDADGVGLAPTVIAGYGNDSRKSAWGWARYYNPTSRPAKFLASKMSTLTITGADRANAAIVDSTDVYDPRFYAIYYPNSAGKYKIVPNSPDAVGALTPSVNGADSQVNPGGEWAKVLTPWDNADYVTEYSTWNRFYMMSLFQNQQMLTYSEHCLIVAEIYAMGLATGDAEAMYNAGIEASIKELTNSGYGNYPDDNAGWVIDVPAADITAMLANPNVVYNAANALEQIRTQRYIDYIHRPDNAWALIRRTNLFDLDVTEPITASGSAVSMIFRLKYPSSELNFNGDNYIDQLNVMGGTDDIRFKSDIFK